MAGEVIRRHLLRGDDVTSDTADRADVPGDGSPSRSRIRLLAAASILVATVLFVGAFLDWRRVLAVVVGADPLLLAVGVVAALAGFAGWSEALRHVLPPDARAVGRRRGFLVYATGGLVRNVLPVGYASSIAVLAYVYRREAAVPLHRSLAAVSVAELLIAVGSTAVAGGGLVLLVASGPVTPLVGQLALGALVLAVGGTLTGALVWYRRETVRRLVHAVAGSVAGAANRLPPRFGDRLAPSAVEESIADYLGALSTVSARRRDVWIAAGYAAFGWLALVAALYASGLAAGYPIPIAVALFVVPVAGYATVLPVPGGLGGYEVGVAGALHLLAGFDLAAALAVTLLFRVCSYWAVIAVGGVASTYLSVDVRRLSSATVDGDAARADGGQETVER